MKEGRTVGFREKLNNKGLPCLVTEKLFPINSQSRLVQRHGDAAHVAGVTITCDATHCVKEGGCE